MPKKSKKKSNVKQIPAKAGAKAKVGSGGKVEVVLKTTKIVKDASRGSYKPRKKTNKKQEASKNQKDAISLLREQIELEKLQSLQRQQQFQPVQRTQNRRTGGDINQFFDKQREKKSSDVSDLQKEVAKLRDDLKKKDEPKPVAEEPKEEKSKFKEELQTTQNEIQRLRIQRGIARRDETAKNKNLQRQIEEVEKRKKIEQSRIRVATRKLDTEKSAREQAQRVSEEQFKLQESLKRAEIARQDRRERQQPNRRPTLKLSQPKTNPSFPPASQKKVPVPEPVPEPEPAPQRFKVGGEVEVPFSSQEELLKAFRNRKNKPRPLPTEKTITEVKTDIISSLDNQPLLAKERERERLVQQKLEVIKDDVKDDAGFDTAEEEEPISIPSSGSVSVPDEEPDDIDTRQEPIKKEESKQRRESFLQEVKSPEVEEKVQSQLRKEADKLRELQESGDKAYADRVQAQIDIQDDERVARDILYEEARKREFNLETEETDDYMRRLKDKKKAEKKKARDNLRKREQSEFLDDVAGDIIRGATEQAVDKRQSDERKDVGRQAVRNIFGRVNERIGSGLANEIITATQNIPRSSGRNTQLKTDEKIAELIQSDFTKTIGRKAYTAEEAKEKLDNQRQASDLKEKIALSFPFIRQSDYDKEMYRKDPNKNKLKQQIKIDLDKAKASGEYTGIQLVKLQTLLERLVEQLSAIKIIEQSKRSRTGGGRETPEERELRLRLEERARENAGGGDGI